MKASASQTISDKLPIISCNFRAKLNEYLFHNDIHQQRRYTRRWPCAPFERDVVELWCPNARVVVFFLQNFNFSFRLSFPHTPTLQQQVIIGLIYRVDHLFGIFVLVVGSPLERMSSPSHMRMSADACISSCFFPHLNWMPKNASENMGIC